jgi:hypothetical protein
MVGDKTCRGIGNKGERCRALALRVSDFCVFHDPDHAEAVAEGRRLGGLRRRREGTLAAAYDFDGLLTVQELRRLLEIATLDTLSLENSVARNRTLMAGVQTAAKLLEVGEHEERLASIEAALGSRVISRASGRGRQ